MAAFQNFRSAVGGFNREDVVHYIEYVNNKHASQLNQLRTEIQNLQAELTQERNKAVSEADLTAQLEAAQANAAQLQQELNQANAKLEALSSQPRTESELEAYRRAERVERVATERVSQLYAQANGVLADTTAKVDETSIQLNQLAASISSQLAQMEALLAGSKVAMQDAAAAMYCIRPIVNQE